MVRAPLSDDEAIYTVVSRALLDGGTLYRDAVDHKPPGLFLLYAGAEWLSSSWGLWILHVATAVVVWGTALGVAAIVRQLRPSAESRAPVWAALAYLAFTTTMMPFDGLAANAELWMGLPTVWAMWLTMVPQGASGTMPRAERTTPARGIGAAALAGALASCAMLLKYQGIAVLPVLALALMMQGGRARLILGRWLALSAGALLPCVLWWVQAYTWGDATETGFWFLFNFRYTAAGVSSPDLLQRTVLRVGFAVAPAAALYAWSARGLWHGVRQRDTGVMLIAAWAAISAAAVAMGGRWFGHYFHQLTAPLAVLLGTALADGPLRRWSRRGLTLATAIPVAGFWMVGWFTPQLMRAIGDPPPDYRAMVAALDALAPRSASVCVWGNAPLLLERAQRPLGCRFVSAHFLTGASPATPAQQDARLADGNIVPGMWDRFLDDLDRRQPALVVDLSPGDIAHWGAFPPSRYPQLAERLARFYTPVATVAGTVIFRRITAGTPAATQRP